jgi:hypothetical protein
MGEQMVNATLAGLLRNLAAFEEFEAMLREAERPVWQPHWSYNDPIIERLTRIGLNREAIRKVEKLLDYMSLAALEERAPVEARTIIAASRIVSSSPHAASLSYLPINPAHQNRQ